MGLLDTVVLALFEGESTGVPEELENPTQISVVHRCGGAALLDNGPLGQSLCLV